MYICMYVYIFIYRGYAEGQTCRTNGSRTEFSSDGPGALGRARRGELLYMCVYINSWVNSLLLPFYICICIYICLHISIYAYIYEYICAYI